jgi:OHCU decarboxylase
MVARRPFDSREDVFAAADAAWSECGPADFQEAFSHHPRIGAQVKGREAAEQAGALYASSSTREELAHVNREYEERFGHIYIVCATGKSAEEMLSIARKRLDNDPDKELQTAAEEQRKIMQLRLRKLFS